MARHYHFTWKSLIDLKPEVGGTDLSRLLVILWILDLPEQKGVANWVFIAMHGFGELVQISRCFTLTHFCVNIILERFGSLNHYFVYGK
jgi:hypothetical protein